MIERITLQFLFLTKAYFCLLAPHWAIVYLATAISSNNQIVLDLLEVLYTKYPLYGTRRMSHELFKLGHSIGRNLSDVILRYRACRYLSLPKGRITNKAHKKYLYLLRDTTITHRNQA